MKLRRALPFLALMFVVLLGGCALKPSTQWWRVGNCLVLYDQTKQEKQLIAVGQSCDIKRDTITTAGDLK